MEIYVVITEMFFVANIIYNYNFIGEFFDPLLPNKIKSIMIYKNKRGIFF